MSYEVKVGKFEGPFDLLLFFIERDELNIYDIPIAKITNDFLDHLHQMQELNLEVASEFILVAATLMRLKAKMLLPRKELDDAGNEIDPREDFVQRLLEYKQYKDVLSQLQTLEEDRLLKFKRGNLISESQNISASFAAYEELSNVDLYKLLKAFNKALEKHAHRLEKPTHIVEQMPYTIASQKFWITTIVSEQGKVSFEYILHYCKTKLEVVFTFLSILELLQLGSIGLLMGDGYNHFWIVKIETPETLN